MTDQEFCEIESKFSGEKIDKIGQIMFRGNDGHSLKEYVEFFLEHSSQHLDLSDVSSTDKFFKQFDPRNSKDDYAKLKIIEWHLDHLYNSTENMDFIQEQLCSLTGLSDPMKAHIREMFGKVKFEDDVNEFGDEER